jgi:hypothetical protein
MDNRQIFCQYCGAANSFGAGYCHSCGRAITAGPAPQPVPQQMYAPPPVPQVISQQAPAQNKGSKACVWIVGIVAFLIVCCGLSAYIYYQYIIPVQITSNDFIGYLQTQNYSQAYNLCGADLQKELSNPDGLQSFLESNGFTNQTWSRRSIFRFGNEAQVTFTNGSTGLLTISLGLDDTKTWKVIGIKFN